MVWLNYPFEKKLKSSGILLGMMILIVSIFVFIVVSVNEVFPTVLISWVGDAKVLTSALMVILGVGLVAYHWQYKKLSRLCGIITLIMGAAITINRVVSIIYPEGFFFGDSIFIPITMNSSFCFALSGILLLLINHPNYKQKTFHTIGIIASFIVAFSVLSLFGYVTGLKSIYGWVKAVRMSAFSAVLFLAYSSAILGIAWDLLFKNNLKFSSLGISIPVGICFLTISLSLWHAVRSQDQLFRQQTIERESNYVVSNIRSYLDETVQEVIRMTKRWELRGVTPEKEWISDAQIALDQQVAILSLQWIDKNLTPQWRVFQQNQPLTKTLKEIPKETLAQGKKNTTFTLYLSEEGPLDYVIWILNPIMTNNEFQGYLAAVIDIPLMINEIYRDSTNILEDVEIRDSKGTLIYDKNNDLNFSNIAVQNFAQFRFQGLNWIINAVFVDTTLSRISYLPAITLFLGFLMSGLVLIAFYFAHQAQVKAKELEESLGKLIQAQDRLVTQEKLASLGGLTAGIAHEIKNPLNFIYNFSQLSLSLADEIKGEIDKYSSNIPKQEYVELVDSINTLNLNLKSIYDQGKKAQNTIARILAQSRGKPGVRMMTDLHSLIEEYITLSYHGMRSQDPTFNTKFEKNFDPRIDRVEIVAEDFSRVLLNLLNNSYYALIEKKKMGGETFRPEVIVTTKHLGDRIEITIHDNGTGISERAKEKLFTPFFTTKPVGYGTGLGLSISRDIIVEGHGGILKCDSKEGDYTNFIIQIPFDMNVPLKSSLKRSEETALNLT